MTIAAVLPELPLTLTPEQTAQLKALNISLPEYQAILKGLSDAGDNPNPLRTPNFTELVMFSALWSEHCSYKHSRHLLKTLPVTGPQVVQGPGENAGIVDAGDGLHIAFKVESHNHPTYVEPFEGAATGVGGILRDIITMNARPVALLNALRFGDLSETANHTRLSRAVAGIAQYGNCMGVPTIGGDVVIHPTYAGNPLVNAMAVGVMQPSGMVAAGAKGVGNPVLYVGSPTGRDGMGGASFASKTLEGEASQADRPAVQVGDPFAEKLLLESCLEAFASGWVASGQDMGAAGLTCATAEMAAKGGLGMEIDLDLVPAREPGMLAWEYLASESQERMLLVAHKGDEDKLIALFERWGVPAVVIGRVIEPERLWVNHHGERVVDLPTPLLTDGTPMIAAELTPAEPDSYRLRREKPATEGLSKLKPNEAFSALKSLLGSYNGASRHRVWEQYDRHVRNGTLLSPDQNTAGLIRLRRPDGTFSERALATTLDGNPLHVCLNPYVGSLGIVAEAARNVACTGAKPLALTNNLNFGNPEVPEDYYPLAWSVKGIADACTALKTPVTGGNVSLYNTTTTKQANGNQRTEGILPSPVVGIVGVLDNYRQGLPASVQQVGHKVALLGQFAPSLGGSQYQFLKQGKVFGEPPSVTLEAEALLIELLTQTLIPQELLQSATDISTGGLLASLAELAFASPYQQPALGLSLNLSPLLEKYPALRLDEALFGETHGSYLLSYQADDQATIETALQPILSKNPEIIWLPLGEVTKTPELSLTLADGLAQSQSLQPLWQLWCDGLKV